MSSLLNRATNWSGDQSEFDELIDAIWASWKIDKESTRDACLVLFPHPKTPLLSRAQLAIWLSATDPGGPAKRLRGARVELAELHEWATKNTWDYFGKADPRIKFIDDFAAKRLSQWEETEEGKAETAKEMDARDAAKDLRDKKLRTGIITTPKSKQSTVDGEVRYSPSGYPLTPNPFSKKTPTPKTASRLVTEAARVTSVGSKAARELPLLPKKDEKKHDRKDDVKGKGTAK